MRSTPYTTKQAKTIANDRKHKKKHRPTRATGINSACRAERFSQTAQYALERSECAPQEKKHTGWQLRPLIQPIKPSKNSRTSHTNKQTRRKKLRQHSTRRHKSALHYKILTHTSHRAKKQKTGFNPNFTRKLTEGAQKNTEKYCVSRETLNILSANFPQTHRVLHCKRQELQKKNSK